MTNAADTQQAAFRKEAKEFEAITSQRLQEQTEAIRRTTHDLEVTQRELSKSRSREHSLTRILKESEEEKRREATETPKPVLDVSIHSDTSTIPQVTSPARGSEYISQDTVQQLQLAMIDMENKLKEGADERESILAAMRIKLEEQERTIKEQNDMITKVKTKAKRRARSHSIAREN